MDSYSRSHLADRDLLSSLGANNGRERDALAHMLADLAEVDARKLYVAAAHPSLHSYCIRELGLSEDEAYKRIQAARAAREIPAIFEMLAHGRLNLSTVCLLAPHLTHENAAGLISGASQLVPEPVQEPSRVEPLSSETIGLHLSISQKTYELLRYAQALAGHQIRPGDLSAVLDRSLKAWVRELERARFAATEHPRRRSHSGATRARNIPADVKRTVWERDGGRCTFVSEAGHRCPATHLLQYDHMEPVARGGRSVMENLRLRCRAHNQFEAERVFGAEFMQNKRVQARAERSAPRRRVDGRLVSAHVAEVVPWLRCLGIRVADAWAAAGLCESMAEASIEDRVKTALRYFSKRSRQTTAGAA